jgi:hypothetical protein
VDRGEYVSIAGVGFIAAVGVYLHRHAALKPALPLFIPWLLYPVLTQGDQLIDNLTINQMRLVSHVILAVIFAAPVIVAVIGTEHLWRPLSRQQLRLFVASALLLEAVVAYVFLGGFMLFTLALMAALFFVASAANLSFRFTESTAFGFMIAAVVVSVGLFFAFKNRPGAYQGSPAAFMDPSQKDAIYDLSSVPASADTKDSPEIQQVLAGYGDVLKGIVHAYWLMDRNYNYAFHNELFWRATPVVPDFRRKALQEILTMRALAAVVDQRADVLREKPALVEELRAFVAFNLRRASTLERMSLGFEGTKAGLQHATHLYEGEGKMVDVLLTAIIEKHDASLRAPRFMAAAHEVHKTYGNRIIGF